MLTEKEKYKFLIDEKVSYKTICAIIAAESCTYGRVLQTQGMCRRSSRRIARLNKYFPYLSYLPALTVRK